MIRRLTKITPSIINNTISNLVALAISTVIHFILTPFIIHTLGKETYGAWILVLSVVEYFGFFDFGISTAIVRFVAHYTGKKDKDSLNEIISSGFIVFLILGCIIFLGGSLISGMLVKFFNIPAPLARDFRDAVLILSLFIGMSFPGGIFMSILRGKELFILANFVNVGTAIIRMGLIVALLSFNQSLRGIASTYIVTAIIGITACYLFSRKVTPYIRLNLQRYNSKMAKLLFKFGMSTTLINLSCILRFQLDSVVIGKTLDLSSVAVYGIASIIMNYFMRIISMFTQTLFPRFSRLDGSNNREAFESLFYRSMLVSSTITSTFAIVLMLGSLSFINLWVGETYLESNLVLVLLLLGYILTHAQAPANPLMFSLNKHYLLGVIWMCEGVVNVILSLLLVKSLGIIGVALGTLIPMVIAEGIIKPWYVCRSAHLSFKRYWQHVSRPILIAIPILPVAYYLRTYLLGCTWFSLFYICLSVSLASLFLIIIVTFSHQDKKELYIILKTRFNFLNK